MHLDVIHINNLLLSKRQNLSVRMLFLLLSITRPTRTDTWGCEIKCNLVKGTIIKIKSLLWVQFANMPLSQSLISRVLVKTTLFKCILINCIKLKKISDWEFYCQSIFEFLFLSVVLSLILLIERWYVLDYDKYQRKQTTNTRSNWNPCVCVFFVIFFFEVFPCMTQPHIDLFFVSMSVSIDEPGENRTQEWKSNAWISRH
jgi:hypothetical protein